MKSVAPAFETEEANGLLTIAEERHYQRIFETQAARSYLYLSLGIGLVAALFPVVLVLSGGYQAHDSISSFYHDPRGPTRDIMVGSLCAIGVFLFLFHGLSKTENWLLNVAGVAVILVALIPSPGDTGYGSTALHRGSAIVFFLLIGVVAIFLSKGRIQAIRNSAVRKRFTLAYTVVGWLMIIMPAVVATIPLQAIASHAMLFAECLGIWSFSAYWFLKTLEYRLLLRIRWLDRPH